MAPLLSTSLRAATVAVLAVAALLASGRPALAHPLGNFTTNTYAGLVATPDLVRVDYVLDLAEIPALRVTQELDNDGDRAVSAEEGDPYRAKRCAELADGIQLSQDGAMLELGSTMSTLTFVTGEAGLSTLRLECRLEAPRGASSDTAALRFTDANLQGRIGWREVTATGDGVTIADSDVPSQSISDRLLRYPQDRLAAPLSVTSAAVRLAPGEDADGVVAPLLPVGGAAGAWFERLTRSFTDLVAERELTLGFGLIAVALATGLGALHSLAPGHGKTVIAAYLVSREGTRRQAVALGLTVAVTHTLGVLLLGVALTVTEALAPQRLYPLLGMVSGVLFALVGVSLLRTALRRRGARAERGRHPAPVLVGSGTARDHGLGHEAHDHGHDHGHGQGHEAHDRDRDHDHEDDHGHTHPQDLRWRSLVAPGVAGGLVPTPSAVLVLVGGMNLDRAWFGLALVLAYGLGMAGVLVAAGFLLQRARDRFARSGPGGTGRFGRLAAELPVVTAVLVLLGGILIAVRAALAVS